MSWDWMKLLALLVTIGGLIISIIKMIKQLRQQSRISYVTTLLKDKEICDGYQAFLMDLKFLFNAIEVFPTLEVTKDSVDDALNNPVKRQLMNQLCQYMKEVFRNEKSGNLHLRKLCPRLSTVLLDHSESVENIFVKDNYKEIINLFREIYIGITFNPGKPWFLTLFAHSKETYNIICNKLSSNTLKEIKDKIDLSSKKIDIESIEEEVRSFLNAKQKAPISMQSSS